MPTNLPPDYFEVERRYRETSDPAEKAALLEQMYSLVPKHKGTDHLRADLRRQLSKLKAEGAAQKKHGYIPDFHVEKEGAGQVILVGPPNTGKSALLASLTNAQPEISEAALTTRKPQPGMMAYLDIQIQLVDTPSLERELTEGGLFALVRQAELTLIVVDIQADPIEQALLSLELLAEHRLVPQAFEEGETEPANLAFRPVILVVNKCDNAEMDQDYAVCCELLQEAQPGAKLIHIKRIPVSALTGRGLDHLKQIIFEHLEIVRVYAKPPGKPADMERPFILKKGATVTDLARKVHRDFFENLKSARVWGGAEFAGQMVHRDYILNDGDVVELKV